MRKKAESSKKIRRNPKAFFIGVVALISTASMSFSPITASAQTPLVTQSISSQSLTTNSSSLIGGTVTDPGTLVGGASGTVGSVVEIVEGVVTDPAITVPEIVQDPAGTVEKVTDPLLNSGGGNQQGTNPVQPPASVPAPPSGLDQVTDIVKDPTKVTDTITDLVQDPTKVVDTIKNTLPGAGGSEDSPGLIKVGLMEKESLAANLQKQSDGKYKLFLDYAGTPTAGFTLLNKKYIFFHMPEEFISLMEEEDFLKSVKATYHVPVIGSSGPSAINSGSVDASAIKIDTAIHSIVLEHSDQLSISLGAASKFSLEIDLEKLPASSDKVYSFASMAYDKNVIDLAVLQDKGAKAEVKLPDDADDDSGDDDGNDPGSDGNGGSGNNGGSGSNAGGNGSNSSGTGGWGDRLPNTASNIWNIGLVGMILFLVGAAIKFNKLKRLI